MLATYKTSYGRIPGALAHPEYSRSIYPYLPRDKIKSISKKPIGKFAPMTGTPNTGHSRVSFFIFTMDSNTTMNQL
jgi:hypothetical protein